MSLEIENKLSDARDKIDELRDSFASLVNFPGQASTKFADLMSSIGEFFHWEIDDVYNAMDEAVDEISRLDKENEDLRDRVEELEARLEEVGESE